MTDEFLQWLREQLDDDERVAASGESWTAFDESQQGTRRVDVDHSFERVVACTRSWRGLHIARHDPARVLREIDAKRQLLDLHGLVHRDLIWLDETGEERTAEIPVCGHCVPRHSAFPRPSAVPQGPCATLRLLALPYADRHGYRDEWRP